MNIKSCTVEEINQLVIKDDVDVVMSVYKISQSNDGGIVKNHTIITITKGNENWYDECMREFKTLFNINYYMPTWGIIVYDKI